MNNHQGLDISFYQKRVVDVSIASSTMRNQGKGVIQEARTFLKNLSLEKFAVATKAEFLALLDEETERLKATLPENARGQWGTARKALNIFLLQASLDHCLSRHYDLQKILPFLEIPLDSYTTKHIRSLSSSKLPRWPGVKNLKLAESNRYQDEATKIAEGRRTYSALLDLEFWRTEVAK